MYVSLDESKKIGVLDFDSSITSIRSLALTNLDEETVVSCLFSSRSMVYLITGKGRSSQLTLHLWQNETMIPTQDINIGIAPLTDTTDKLYTYTQFEQTFMLSISFIH